ncbi:hypothetical protein BDV12DRAFT_178138 [Aspergillus spectabilis]
MPPTFRSSRSGRQFGDGVNRTRTGQVDHDVTEGLPVRRWTRQSQTVSQEPKTEGVESEVPGHSGKQSIPEHPMPRDSHLLTPVSRALLRAARAGCIYIRPASKEFEDDEKEATDLEEQQTQQNTERNFSMRKWTTVPRHLEAPEVEFLAQRRPGLPSIYAAPAAGVDGANGFGPMRKTRFKKVDPVTGNISVYAAWVPEGHKIEGEISDEAQLIAENSKVAVIPEAPAPGTIIEGVGVVNAQGVVVAEAGSAAVLTPPRRRPPPPKRKGKGLKGRRKKVMFAPGEGADASLVHGAGAGASDNTATYGKETDSSRMSVDQTTQDDEDDEGEEGEESDDGEGDESGLDAKTPETPGPRASTEPEPEPKIGPAVAPAPIPIPVKTESRAQTQTPQASRPDSRFESLETSAESVAPFHPENATSVGANLTGPAPPQKPSETTAVAPIIDDVQMTDSEPTNNTVRLPSIPASEYQLQAITAVAQPVSTENDRSIPQEVQQHPTSDPSQVAAGHTEESTSQQIADPTDIDMTELPDTEPFQDVLTEAPQPSVPVQAPSDESVSEQAGQQQNEFDLLDNLEVRLAGISNETPSDEQKDIKPEQQPEIAPNQEAADFPDVPLQPPAEAPIENKPAEAASETRTYAHEEPTAPPVEELTPPELEQTINQETANDNPVEQVPQPTEIQQPEHVPETPAQPEPLSSTEPVLGIVPAQTTEQPEQNPQQAGTERTPSEPPALPGVILEPPATQSPRQDPVFEAAADPKALANQGQLLGAAPETASQPATQPIVEPSADSTLEQPDAIAEDPSQPLPEHQDAWQQEAAPEQQSEKATASAAQDPSTSDDGSTLHGEQQSS